MNAFSSPHPIKPAFQKRLEINTGALDSTSLNFMQEIAERQHCSLGELALELLAEAISGRRKSESDHRAWRRLSRREQEIVALACSGLTNKEIAVRLVISNETVKTHLHNAAYKFGLKSKVELCQTLEDSGLSRGRAAQDRETSLKNDGMI